MLKEALPLLIERKDAFHLLLKQVSAEFALPHDCALPHHQRHPRHYQSQKCNHRLSMTGKTVANLSLSRGVR